MSASIRKIAIFVVLGLVIGLPSAIAQTTLKLATVAPDGTTWMREMRSAAEMVETATEGRVRIKFYPGGVMGNAPTVLRKMRIGQLHGGAFTSGELAGLYPDFFVYGIPFLFHGRDEVRFVRAELDDRLREGLKARGLTMLGIAGGGFAYLMSDSEITSGEDLINAKVWVPEGDEVSALSLELAGVSPIPLPLSDVYTGLQTGLIDTVVNTPAGAIAFQWHTKVDYLTDVPVAYVVGVLAVDNKAIDRLSESDRRMLIDIMSSALERLEEINEADNIEAKAVLSKEGITAVEPAADEMEFWHELAGKTVTELEQSGRLEFELLDDIQELLRTYRARAAVEQHQ
ncbi:MAG: TRAP transporter substrate-binding protein DctP [Xanthomonadales bacterium]|nr:TRAP transporter substrate-binding protein DctP [Xanthomonadales bacterium]